MKGNHKFSLGGYCADDCSRDPQYSWTYISKMLWVLPLSLVALILTLSVSYGHKYRRETGVVVSIAPYLLKSGINSVQRGYM